VTLMTDRVIVTGGASGIGAATCQVLRDLGYDPVQGLVNCAGIRTRSLIVDTSVDEFERHLRVNVTGTWLGVRELFRRHTDGSKAAIVNIASVNAIIAVPGQAHYVASKGGVAALTKAAAIEGAPMGIRVNAIAPGPIRTPMTEERLVDPAQVEWLQGRVPLGRVGEAPEMGQVAAFLLSAAASYVTGTTIYADGGWVANGV
jgi:NAD(P)-dependent dehydrogenase (short-subunit alcohol dehydrogenase family)